MIQFYKYNKSVKKNISSKKVSKQVTPKLNKLTPANRKFLQTLGFKVLK